MISNKISVRFFLYTRIELFIIIENKKRNVLTKYYITNYAIRKKSNQNQFKIFLYDNLIY